MYTLTAELCDHSKVKKRGGGAVSSPMYKSQLTSPSDSHEVLQILFRVKSAMTSDSDHFPHLDSSVCKPLDLAVRYRVMQVRQLVNFYILEMDSVQETSHRASGSGCVG